MATFGVNPLNSNSSSKSQPIKAQFGSKLPLRSNLPSRLNAKPNLPSKLNVDIDKSIFAGSKGVLSRRDAAYRIKNLIEREARTRGTKIKITNIRKLFSGLDKNQYSQYERILNDLLPQKEIGSFVESSRDKLKITRISKQLKKDATYAPTIKKRLEARAKGDLLDLITGINKKR